MNTFKPSMLSDYSISFTSV